MTRAVSLIRSSSLSDVAEYAYAATAPSDARLIFLAGSCPLGADGTTVGVGDYAAQAASCVENLRTALADAGADLRDVISTRVLVASAAQVDLVAAWEAVRDAFADHDPPSTLLGVTALGYDHQLVEVEAIAAVGAEVGDPSAETVGDPLSSHALPLDHAAAAAMWSQYRAAHPEAVAAAPEYTVEHFGDSPRLADELLDIVVSGRKRATAELVADFVARGDAVPRVGSHWIACDGAGTPRIVIRSVELRLGPFASADARFAADEGEDDLSLESWRREHRRYWTRVSAARGATWSEDDEIVFERFRVVWPPELADRP